jgi:transposase InsO family protein
MNQLGLKIKQEIQGDNKFQHLIVPNVLNREFTVTEPSTWVSDITYIRVKEGFYI